MAEDEVRDTEPLETREDLTRPSVAARAARTDDLEARNRLDDSRQDRSDGRQDRSDDRQTRGERRTRDLADLEPGSRLYNEVLEVKQNVLDMREDFLDFKEHDFSDLRKHVNHEVEAIQRQLASKLDNQDLLTSLGFHLLKSTTFRWAAGLVGATVFSTVFVRELIGPYGVDIAISLFHLLGGG